MCGIFGGTNLEWNYDQTLETLRHRGPDSQKCVSLDDLALGFTRLAIIDLSARGDQPMVDVQKEIWIVFNGEIYGYKSLRNELISLGHKFNSTSDTEVILNAYREWGDAFTDHIDGMFAIAIYDSRTNELKLYRDRIGIKPLYYYWDGKHFAFASELKGLLTLCHDVDFSYDVTALYDFLTYGYIPEPKSLYKNVFKMLPANRMTFQIKEKVLHDPVPYWQLTVGATNTEHTFESAQEHLKFLINESVNDQLVADVPVGCFLSGGVDSSVVVAEASKQKPDLQTFSIGFDDEKFTEVHFAKKVAEHFGVKNHSKTLSSQHSGALFENLRKWYDEPFSDTSAMPSYLVAEYARKKMKVVLTGDGGDEVFGGYPRYARVFGWNKKRFENRFLNSMLKGMFSFFPHRRLIDPIELWTGNDLAFFTIITLGMSTFYKRAYAKEWGISKDYDTYWYFRKHYHPELPCLTRFQHLDLHTYLPSDILTKVDRVTMAVSLEARVPLLSRKIVEFSFSLPEAIRFNLQGDGEPVLKGLLKETYRQDLSSEIIDRKKMGFSIPPIHTEGRQTVEEMMLAHFFDVSI